VKDIGAKSALNIQIIQLDSAVAAEAEEVAEDQCVVNHHMEIVVDQVDTVVIPTLHPLHHLTCVKEWTVMDREAMVVVAAAMGVDMTPEVEIPMPAVVNPWAVLEQAQCTTDEADPQHILGLEDVETWADLVQCEDLIHTHQGIPTEA